jgi:hypothetical protein
MVIKFPAFETLEKENTHEALLETLSRLLACSPAHDQAAAVSTSNRSGCPDATRKLWEGHSPLAVLFSAAFKCWHTLVTLPRTVTP